MKCFTNHLVYKDDGNRISGQLNMEYLIYSVISLAIAPLLYFFLQSFADGFKLFDRLAFLVVTGIVTLLIVPECFQVIGLWAIPALVCGALVPTLVEKKWYRLVDEAHLVAVILAIVGVALHGMLDGLAISHGVHHPEITHSHGQHLPLAITLHRLPAALFIFWLFYPKFGWKRPSVILFFIGLCTVLGFFISNIIHIEKQYNTPWFWSVFQAVSGGSLFHLSFHRHTQGDCEHGHSH